MSTTVNAVGLLDKEPGISWNQRVQIIDNTALPHYASLPAICVKRRAGDFAVIIYAAGRGINISGKRAQIRDAAVTPEKCMMVNVTEEVRFSDYLITIVYRRRQITISSAETTEISHRTVTS